MTLKSFLLGMFVSFGLAWMFVIAIPVAKMGNLDPVKMTDEEDAAIYQRKFSGRVKNGAQIYAANGCYACHTQLIRPTYAGHQIWRDDMAGVVDTDGNDTRRETTHYDYAGEQWFLQHLYNPRNNELRVGEGGEILDMSWSNCPSQGQMFKEQPITGQGDSLALSQTEDGDEIVPKEDARVLISYLMSLRRDDAVPDSMDFSPKKVSEENK